MKGGNRNNAASGDEPRCRATSSPKQVKVCAFHHNLPLPWVLSMSVKFLFPRGIHFFFPFYNPPTRKNNQTMSDPRPEMSQANEACVGPQSEAAGKASSCQGCPNANICASGAAKGEDPDLEHIKQRMSQVKRKVMVLSGKGGVGKSTMTKELAMSLGRLETNVGIMDTDICGPSMPRMTGTRGDSVHRTNDGWEPMFVDDSVSLISIQPLLEGENDAVVFRGPRKNGLIKNFLKDVTWGDLDILLIDTPPGTSDEHLSIVQYLGDCGGYYGAIVVTTPQEVAVSDVRRELNFCKKRSIPVIGIIENMSGFVCPNCKGESEVFPAKKGEALSAGQRLV